MRYDDQELQDLLAAEFVLGNLRGAARRRLIALMQQAPALRAKVEHWEERLFPLMMNPPPEKTPARVWRAIQARIAPRRDPAPAARRGWRRFALGGLAFALGVLLYIGVAPPGPPPFTMVAVLNDAQAQPGILMSWTPRQAAQRQLQVRILSHPDMAAGTSWQAWLITADGGAPISLGFVTAAETQVLEISAAAADALPKATAIGVSIEPKEGSTSGRPSGPFLFQGPALRVEG
jgi:anti-sigma-K factor RskA